jgi:MFS family permease
MGLNRLINERVGLGAFQVQAFLVLCMVDMNDGVELVLSSFLNPIIRAVFPDATSGYVELLASIFYVGILVGSLTSGGLADRYGRRRLIACGAVLQIGVSLMFYYAVTLEFMLLLRFCYGFSFGFTVAVTTSMFAEISPTEYRGKGILLINFCISIGKLYAVVLGHLFLKENLAETDWKLMMICGGLPNVLVFLGALYVLEESPRYLLVHQ